MCNVRTVLFLYNRRHVVTNFTVLVKRQNLLNVGVHLRPATARNGQYRLFPLLAVMSLARRGLKTSRERSACWQHVGCECREAAGTTVESDGGSCQGRPWGCEK